MRSDIIRDMPEPEYMELDPPILALGAVAYWLKEIALQLATMNEQYAQNSGAKVNPYVASSSLPDLQKGQNT